jgi:hypothetical protein
VSKLKVADKTEAGIPFAKMVEEFAIANQNMAAVLCC